MAAEQDDLVTVRLLDVPVGLRFASMEHGDGLVREMVLLQQDPASSVPVRLVELADEVANVYGPFTTAANEELEKAYRSGVGTLPELVYRVPSSIGALITRIRTVLTEVDEYCRSGKHLLTLETPPDIATYRAWSLDEFTRQLAGELPTPWPEYAAARGAR